MIRKFLPVVLAAATASGVVLVAVWPDATVTSESALTIERLVANSMGARWAALPPGQCVVAEVVLPSDDADASRPLMQRAWEVCHRSSGVESADPAAYYAERVVVECRQAARRVCKMDLDVDAGPIEQADQIARQQCSQEAQEKCAAESARYGVAWTSEPYAWVAQPAVRSINRPGAIWRAHGCVCAVAGQASRYWPEGADASVPIPRRQVVAAKTVTGTVVDAPCVETWARLEAGEQLGMCQ